MTAGKAKEVLERYQSVFAIMHREPKKAAGNMRSPRDQRVLEQHLHWMCNSVLGHITNAQLADKDILDGKFSRWLGFVQGCFWALGVYTIDELRQQNKT